MTSVQELKGIGAGKDIVLIGNGHSVMQVDWWAVRKDLFTFGCNKQLQPVDCDFMIYYDLQMREWYDGHGKKEVTKLISFKNFPSKYTDYTYDTVNDVFFCDSGCHALQIACNIMCFDNIYLIGYDYNTDTEKIRFTDERDASDDEMKRYTNSIFTRALWKYNHSRCAHATSIIRDGLCNCAEDFPFKHKNIFQLNSASRLKMFIRKPVEAIYE